MVNLPRLGLHPAVLDLMNTRDWTNLKPAFIELLDMPLNETTIESWLTRLTKHCEIVQEAGNWLRIRYMQDMSNEDSRQQFNQFLADVMQPYWDFVPQLYQKLFAVQHLLDNALINALQVNWLQLEISEKMTSQLKNEEIKLSNQYFKITGEAPLQIDGQDYTLVEAEGLTKYHNRALRQKAWQTVNAYYLDKNTELNDLWIALTQLRTDMQQATDYPDYITY